MYNASTMQQHVPQPVPSISASTMHQTCTNNLSQQPVKTTYHNNLYHQNHHPNMICNSITELVYMITDLQTFFNFNNKRHIFIKLYFSFT
jgi:hypothetical protein